MAICSLNTGSLGPVSRRIETEFGIRQQHPKRGNSITRSTAIKCRWQNRIDLCAYQHGEQTIAVLIPVENTRIINQKTTPKGRGFYLCGFDPFWSITEFGSTAQMISCRSRALKHIH